MTALSLRMWSYSPIFKPNQLGRRTQRKNEKTYGAGDFLSVFNVHRCLRSQTVDHLDRTGGGALESGGHLIDVVLRILVRIVQRPEVVLRAAFQDRLGVQTYGRRQ